MTDRSIYTSESARLSSFGHCCSWQPEQCKGVIVCSKDCHLQLWAAVFEIKKSSFVLLLLAAIRNQEGSFGRERGARRGREAVDSTSPCVQNQVLCGAPGSGKSTFSAQLSAANPAWERVNQVMPIVITTSSMHACMHAPNVIFATI